ncbi:MAG: T9SS type A sorting domain-containing protein [Bacteroidetes bacterium]|nr:T9SS type A sorting domain-containing protein [Bacteroidota bacterium]
MNIYKKTVVCAVMITVAMILISNPAPTAQGNVAGAPIGKTGSPGDASNCTGCHAGTASAGGSITSDVPASGYIPGTTYTITASITVSGLSRFGFEVSPQSATGLQKGSLVVTNSTETKLVGSTAKYITHKTAGTSGVGFKTWSFNWTAPVSGSGNAIMYGAFMASNANGTNTGDQVFLSNLLIQEDLTASIASYASEIGMVIYPNPAQEKLYVKTIDAYENIGTLEIIDISGRIIKTINYEKLSQGKSIDITDLPGGVYVLRIHSDNGIGIKKFIKN